MESENVENINIEKKSVEMVKHTSVKMPNCRNINEKYF